MVKVCMKFERNRAIEDVAKLLCVCMYLHQAWKAHINRRNRQTDRHYR